MITGQASRAATTLGALLWIIALGIVALVWARETERLPHVLPVLNWPIDEEGALKLELDARPPAADCPPDSARAMLHPLAPAELAKRLEAGTVLVLTERASGSGFFISATHILTNRHVVEGQADGRVIVTSKSLGHTLPGKVVASTPNAQPGAPDFAVIEIAAAPSAQPFAIGPMVEKLQRVTVAGYPGLSMQTDPGFERLVKEGDVAAAPGLRISEGSVSNLLVSSYRMTEIDHSAEILHGNSGGPLVDSCGRAVGINSFIAVDQSQSGRINYALAAQDFSTFLVANHIAFDQDDRKCS